MCNIPAEFSFNVGNHKVANRSLNGCVGVSRLCPCFRLTTGFRINCQRKIAIVNLVHCRLTPTRCFSKTSPT
ncbi:MAG: hypothetical protein LBK82_01085 [Planctomycetaceae bacterium]|nr:hypothetical protein [Planctomycetaceae bacterium]